MLGTDLMGTAALDMLMGSLAPRTYNYYVSGIMRTFVAFCDEEGIRALDATPGTIIRYTSWLGLQGTVAAESLQQFFCAINKSFRNHQRQPMALGEIRADARCGLQLQRIAEEDVRVALPAPVIGDIF
eukprot:jgi/Tetstr1/433512/TSEL_022782.t1